jgi:hypothetical protein
VLIQESMNDTVVPNSSTTDLVNSMPGMTQLAVAVQQLALPQVSLPYVGSTLSQFPGAEHAVLLSPVYGNTAEAQEQALGFLSPAGAPAGDLVLTPNPSTTTSAPTPAKYSHTVYFGK